MSHTTPLEDALSAFHRGEAVVVQFGTTTGLFFPLFDKQALAQVHQVKNDQTPIGKRPITLVATLELIMEMTDFNYIFGEHTPAHKHERQAELRQKFWSLDPSANDEQYVPNIEELRRTFSQVAIFRLPLRDDFSIHGKKLPEWAVTFDPEEQKYYVQVVNFGAIGGDVQRFFDQLMAEHQVIGCTSANRHGESEIVDEVAAAKFAQESGLAFLSHHNTPAFAAQPGSYTILSLSRISESRQDFIRIERFGNLHPNTIKSLWGEHLDQNPAARQSHYQPVEFPADLLPRIFHPQLSSYQRAQLMTKIAQLLDEARDRIDFDQLLTTLEEDV